MPDCETDSRRMRTALFSHLFAQTGIKQQGPPCYMNGLQRGPSQRLTQWKPLLGTISQGQKSMFQ